MEEISFNVQGSESKPYEVTFLRNSPTNLSAYCTCRAGENGQYCKHRFSILEGITQDVVSENIDQVAIVKSWLPGTDIERALNKLRELEDQENSTKKQLSAAKKSVAKAMRD